MKFNFLFKSFILVLCTLVVISCDIDYNEIGTDIIGEDHYNFDKYTDASFFPDYPKFSVWHNAYYAYSRDFNAAGNTFLGSSVWAFDRTAMLAGAGTAQMVRTRIPSAGNPNISAMGSVGLEGMVPSSQNGLFIVPTGATTLNIFEVTPNFGASTITVGPLTPLPVV